MPEIASGIEPCGRILVLGPAMQMTYRRVDVEAVWSFVERGGGVLVVADAENAYNMAEFQNDMLEQVG